MKACYDFLSHTHIDRYLASHVHLVGSLDLSLHIDHDSASMISSKEGICSARYAFCPQCERDDHRNSIWDQVLLSGPGRSVHELPSVAVGAIFISDFETPGVFSRSFVVVIVFGRAL